MNANYFKKRIYPNIYLEDKISGAGTISILDEPKEGEGFYDLFTGEKVELPMAGLDDLLVLAYMTDEQAVDYFDNASHIGRFDIKVDERSGHFDEDEPEEPDTNPEQPTNPDVDNPNNTDDPGNNPDNGDQDMQQEPTQPPEGEGTNNPDNPDSGDQNTPQQPEQPPHGSNDDDPTDTPPQTPEQPEEPPQGDTSDKPVDTTPDTPQPPQKPSDGDNSGDDNYTPPADYRPLWYPAWPVVTVKPTEGNKPQEQPDNTPVPAKPQLVCNEAVIDTSRTVVLLGYGDGLLHESDPLTRAQLATIIYRLLDDESIAKYSNAQVTFADVAADAWYAPYVRVIQAAGIVNGVGDGA